MSRRYANRASSAIGSSGTSIATASRTSGGRHLVRDRQVAQPLQQLLVEVGGAIGERAGALRIPVEVAHRLRPVGHRAPPCRLPPRPEATPRASPPEDVLAERPRPSPRPGSRAPRSRGASARAGPASSSTADAHLLAGRHRRRARAEDVEPVQLGHELGRPTPASTWRSAAGRPAGPTSSKASVAQRLTSWCARARSCRRDRTSARCRAAPRPSTRGHVGGAGLRQPGLHVDVRQVEPACSATPRISKRAQRARRSRTAPMVAGGQRSSSIEPPSPRVAVTHTTRDPLRTARP